MSRLMAMPILFVALALVAWGRAEAEPSLRIQSSGPVRMSNSLSGRAILSASNVAPGKSAQGKVAISNLGPRSVTLSLGLRRQRANSRLQSQMLLTIWEYRRRGARVVFSGSLAKMPKLRLGVLRPREKRLYLFSATLSPLAANEHQGASLRFACRWTFARARAS